MIISPGGKSPLALKAISRLALCNHATAAALESELAHFVDKGEAK